jgi:hypothetical protein
MTARFPPIRVDKLPNAGGYAGRDRIPPRAIARNLTSTYRNTAVGRMSRRLEARRIAHDSASAWMPRLPPDRRSSNRTSPTRGLPHPPRRVGHCVVAVSKSPLHTFVRADSAIPLCRRMAASRSFPCGTRPQGVYGLRPFAYRNGLTARSFGRAAASRATPSMGSFSGVFSDFSRNLTLNGGRARKVRVQSDVGDEPRRRLTQVFSWLVRSVSSDGCPRLRSLGCVKKLIINNYTCKNNNSNYCQYIIC